MHVIAFISTIFCLISYLFLSFYSRSCRDETFFLMMNIFVFDRFVCTISHMMQTDGRVSAITRSHRSLMIVSKVVVAAAAAACKQSELWKTSCFDFLIIFLLVSSPLTFNHNRLFASLLHCFSFYPFSSFFSVSVSLTSCYSRQIVQGNFS